MNTMTIAPNHQLIFLLFSIIALCRVSCASARPSRQYVRCIGDAERAISLYHYYYIEWWVVYIKGVFYHILESGTVSKTVLTNPLQSFPTSEQVLVSLGSAFAKSVPPAVSVYQ